MSGDKAATAADFTQKAAFMCGHSTIQLAILTHLFYCLVHYFEERKGQLIYSNRSLPVESTLLILHFGLFCSAANMGVPKFFRWLSERYPAISQLIAENRIPEFDCLYLDMSWSSSSVMEIGTHMSPRWNHTQLHTQRHGLAHVSNDRRENVHQYLQLY